MFKSTASNPKAMMAAQKELEAIQSNFERQEFRAEHDGVTVTIMGDRTMKSIDGADEQGKVNIADLLTAYNQAADTLEHQRNLHLVRLRNQIQKQFRVDIKAMIPEIAAAVVYMEQRSAAN